MKGAAWKKWRKNNRKYRNSRRKSNYDKTKIASDRIGIKPKSTRHRPWSEPEILVLLNPEISDREMSTLIKRSVQAIQQKRYSLNKGLS